MSRDCEVLVVGAGPTGLMAADLLKRAGVDVRLVERRTEATRESRAFAVQARTVELLRFMGLADAFVARGIRAEGVNIHVAGKHRGGLDFRRAAAADTPYPFILMIPQAETERLLGEDCERLGLTVERGVTVEDIEEDDDGVVARIAAPQGADLIRARYVIGADGPRSVVRRAAELSWSGDTLPQKFLLADCRVDWPLDHGQFRVFLHGKLIGLFLPLDGERVSRVMATDLSGGWGDDDASRPAPLDLTEMQAGLRAATNLPVTLSDPVWVTRYRAHHRFVDRYRAGRMFVAGDAAHIHSPAGGQGMNTGLQDAANLAWKLGAVIRRGAGDALLDSYDAERRPVGEAVVRSTGKLFNAAAGQAGWKAAARDRAVSALLPIISRLPPFQTKAFMGASQRAVGYERSPFVNGTAGAGPGPGARAPDARLKGGAMFDLLAGYGFHVLAMSRSPLAADEEARTLAALGRLPAHAAGHLIAGGPGEPFDRYGVGKDGAATLLVRPDGYVAWRGDGVDVEGAAAFLRRFGETQEALRHAA